MQQIRSGVACALWESGAQRWTECVWGAEHPLRPQTKAHLVSEVQFLIHETMSTGSELTIKDTNYVGKLATMRKDMYY